MIEFQFFRFFCHLTHVFSQDDPDEPLCLRLGLPCESNYESPFKTAPPNLFWLDDKFLAKFPRNCFYTVIEGNKREEEEEEAAVTAVAVSFDIRKRIVVNASFLRIDCNHSRHDKIGLKLGMTA